MTVMLLAVSWNRLQQGMLDSAPTRTRSTCDYASSASYYNTALWACQLVYGQDIFTRLPELPK
jgi:hypothetical protein